ncbi:MAG: TetR/AcrR family transcriptional regulator [Bacteroidota bacterium]
MADFKSMSKDRIIKGAEELFFRYGIKSVTMDDIARHLGISKKTIYRSFKEKDEIVNLLMQLSIEEDKKQFRQIADSAQNVVDEVFKMMQCLTSIISKLNPVIFYDLQKYHPSAWSLFVKFKSDFILHMVEETITKGIKQGYVRSDLNPRILARLRVEEIEMGFNPKVFPPDKFKMLEVQLALMEHFLYGICTLKGHKLVNKYKQITEEE